MRKNYFSVILLICLCFLLVGCNASKDENTNSTSVDERIANINERIEGTNLAVTFTEFETPTDDLGKGSYKLGDNYEYTKDGYVNRLAHFTIENIGKNTIEPVDSYINATLNYGEGYKFSPGKTWYHVYGIYDKNGQEIEGGSWVNSIPELSPFDEPLECIIAFLIPEEVANGTDSLSLTLEFDEQKYVINIR